MVAANQDGPNFGYNEFYVTCNGYISHYNTSQVFESPIDDVSYGELFRAASKTITRMEVFQVESLNE